MLLIRPKPKAPFKRTHIFSLGDLLQLVLVAPFLFLAAMIIKVFEEGMAMLILFVPMFVYAYMVTDGTMHEIIQFFKDNWKLPVYTVLLLVSLAKLLRIIDKSNKKYK